MKKKNLTKRHRLLVSMPRLLLLFLIEKKILTKFMDNCDKLMLTSDVNYACNRRDRASIFDYFYFIDTEEGADYWNELLFEYRIYLRNKKAL